MAGVFVEVPYEIRSCRKQNPYSCGPAALRMALTTLTGIDISEENLIEALQTTPEAGSSFLKFEENLEDTVNFIAKANNTPLTCVVQKNSSFDEIGRLSKAGYILLLNHKKKTGESHWSVFDHMNNTQIVLMDPDTGDRNTYPLEDFKWTGGSDVVTQQALVGIKRD